MRIWKLFNPTAKYNKHIYHEAYTVLAAYISINSSKNLRMQGMKENEMNTSASCKDELSWVEVCSHCFYWITCLWLHKCFLCLCSQGFLRCLVQPRSCLHTSRDRKILLLNDRCLSYLIRYTCVHKRALGRDLVSKSLKR